LSGRRWRKHAGEQDDEEDSADHDGAEASGSVCATAKALQLVNRKPGG
jgi:hypothetical protein